MTQVMDKVKVKGMGESSYSSTRS